jgi:GNAT superfamily N-acetyltransferase
MDVMRRPFDVDRDREFVLQLHGQANYAGESAWARGDDEAAYIEHWLTTPQVVSFLQSLELSGADPRTIAEIWEQEGRDLGFLWVTFTDVVGYDTCIAEVRDIAVVEDRRGQGVGAAMMAYIEDQAHHRGAHVIRSDVGALNGASQGLHESCGYEVQRKVFEKVLCRPQSAK